MRGGDGRAGDFWRRGVVAVVFQEGMGYATILSGKIGYPEGRVGVCGENDRVLAGIVGARVWICG